MTDTGTVALKDGAALEGYCTLSAPILVSGSATSSGNIIFGSTVSGSGTLYVDHELTLLGAVANTVTLTFGDPGSVIIGDQADFGATIDGWASNDTLELLNVAATSDRVSGQTLILYNSDDHAVARLQFAQVINAGDFSLQQSQSNTIITHPS